MKREILFRAKRVDGSHNWVCGSLIESKGKYFIIQKNNLIVGNNNTISNTSVQVVKTETVCQFTGLTDKNGTKIFEGDIVKEKITYQVRSEIHMSIVCDDRCNPCFVLKRIKLGAEHCSEYEYDFIKCGLTELEVIGNIYDNSELLK